MIRTLIEWATHTLNFWWGCTKVSEACAHCYAEVLAKIFSKGKATWGPGGARWLRPDAAKKELAKIVRIARRSGHRPRVFVNSMSDTFEANTILDAVRLEMLLLFEGTPEVDILLLTKRPENVREMVPMTWLCGKWPAHVWIGTTVENQAAADERIPLLLAVPAAVRFLSCEPLLGPVEFSNVTKRSDAIEQLGKKALTGIHWVIVGGESGNFARPMHPDWARSLRRQCVAVGVPFFFKQWGEWSPEDQNLDVPFSAPNFRSQRCGEMTTYRVGKKLAGRELDGRTWDEVPAAEAKVA